MDFGIAKFRIAKFSHCEIGIGIAKWTLALRNFFLALRNFRNAKFRKRAIFAKLQCTGDFGFRNAKLVCEQFAKFSHCEIGLRTVCENPVLLIFHAFLPVFNCISFSSLFLRFSIDFWAC